MYQFRILRGMNGMIWKWVPIASSFWDTYDQSFWPGVYNPQRVNFELCLFPLDFINSSNSREHNYHFCNALDTVLSQSFLDTEEMKYRKLLMMELRVENAYAKRKVNVVRRTLIFAS